MFGYVFINKQEMKFREFDIYRSYYCGLCRVLKEKYGLKGSLSLSYDMTFLIMLLTGLYEPDTQYSTCKCLAHPLEKHPVRKNKYTEYAADMTIVFAYYKCMDDWKDEKKIIRLAYGQSLLKAFKKVNLQYPEKVKKIKLLFDEIDACEKNEEKSIDKISGLFGELLAEIFQYEKDFFEEDLRRTGFYLGKFIYLMDAYEDLEKDLKTNNYNVFRYYAENSDFQEYSKNVLTMMMAECSRSFERLPILENIEILKNIIYAGVWTRYEVIQNKGNNKK